MSSTDVRAERRRQVPVYKRRRRRIYGGIAVLAAVAIALVGWAVSRGTGSGTSAALPGFTISVSQGSVASPDSIIESQPSLAKAIPAHLHYVPFDAGVTAIAEMKSGSVQAISGVGNPPLTAAIGTGTGVTVVMGWGFDDDQLLVPKSVTSAAQLAGKSVAVLVGSSEDYELLGYLGLEHLTGKVKVVPFGSETAAGAAAQSGAVNAAYVYGVPAANLSAKGYHPLVNAEQIAKLGIPGLDVIAVASNLVRSDPALVQAYVCAELRGSRDMTGPQAARYLTATPRAGRARPRDRGGNQELPVHPAQPAAVLARVGAERYGQPDRAGLRADRQVPGRPGTAHVGTVRGPDRVAHRRDLHQEGAGRWLPELTPPAWRPPGRGSAAGSRRPGPAGAAPGGTRAPAGPPW